MAHIKLERRDGVLYGVGVVDKPQDAPGTTKVILEGTQPSEEQIVAPEATESETEASVDAGDTPPQEPEEIDSDNLTCVECGKLCSSAAGLAAHVRAKHKE